MNKIKQLAMDILENSVVPVSHQSAADAILEMMSHEEVIRELRIMMYKTVEGVFKSASRKKQDLLCGATQMSLPYAIHVEGCAIIYRHATTAHIMISKRNSRENMEKVLAADERYQRDTDELLVEMQKRGALTAGEVLQWIDKEEEHNAAI